MFDMYPMFRDLRQFLFIVTLMSEVLLTKHPRLYLIHVDFTRYLVDVYSVVSGLDWNHWTESASGSSAGLGAAARGFGLDWILSTQSILMTRLQYRRTPSPYSTERH